VNNVRRNVIVYFKTLPQNSTKEKQDHT